MRAHVCALHACVRELVLTCVSVCECASMCNYCVVFLILYRIFNRNAKMYSQCGTSVYSGICIVCKTSDITDAEAEHQLLYVHVYVNHRLVSWLRSHFIVFLFSVNMLFELHVVLLQFLHLRKHAHGAC